MRIGTVQLHRLSASEMLPASWAALAMLAFCLLRIAVTDWFAQPAQLFSYTFAAFFAVYLDRAGFHLGVLENFFNFRRLLTYLAAVCCLAIFTFLVGIVLSL